MVIDHIDHDTTNNRVENLRLVTIAENNRNLSKVRGANPYTGVYANRKRWSADIELNGKTKRIGTFDTPEEARDARKQAERLFGFHPNHGIRKATAEAVAGTIAA